MRSSLRRKARATRWRSSTAGSRASPPITAVTAIRWRRPSFPRRRSSMASSR
jgi:hypothetical protein